MKILAFPALVSLMEQFVVVMEPVTITEFVIAMKSILQLTVAASRLHV